MLRSIIIAFLVMLFYTSSSQENFKYSVEITAVDFPGLPGLHSFAFAQHEGKWLIVGGRRDGVHPRQPFNAFPPSQNNTSLYVFDVNTKQLWSAPLSGLPAGLEEQLQSANMNFLQREDTLYVIGGYAYSASANDHISFPNLSTIQVSSLIHAIVQGTAISSCFKQISDERFAVAGGQLGKIGNRFYLVGGHRFDGRYNPMGHSTFTQTYTSQVRSFEINNSGNLLSISNYNALTDAVHLRRRDYNLLPQIFPDGTQGYTISSGVFQPNADLPYLYPVDVKENGIIPHTGFNQYLSNYHSAKASLFDSAKQEMYSIFFGGISQYNFTGENLVQDNQVPFIKTVSLLTRSADGKFREYKLPVELPGFLGAGAEFIANSPLPHTASEIIRLDRIEADEILLGHIYGGINSTIKNAFSINNSGATSAGTAIYSVKLKKNTVSSLQLLDGSNPYSIRVVPNPFKNQVEILYTVDHPVKVYYYVSSHQGQIIQQHKMPDAVAGKNSYLLSFQEPMAAQVLILTIVFDNKFFVSQRIIKE